MVGGAEQHVLRRGNAPLREFAPREVEKRQSVLGARRDAELRLASALGDAQRLALFGFEHGLLARLARAVRSVLDRFEGTEVRSRNGLISVGGRKAGHGSIHGEFEFPTAGTFDGAQMAFAHAEPAGPVNCISQVFAGCREARLSAGEMRKQNDYGYNFSAFAHAWREIGVWPPHCRLAASSAPLPAN